MNHYLNSKPSFQSIVDKQRIAYHRLNIDKTTRSGPELGHYRRTLQPIPLGDVELPRLPLAQVAGDSARYAVLGEIAQLPGRVILVDIASGMIDVGHSLEQLMLISPTDLET